MSVYICDEKECTGCGACYNVCPFESIEMKLNQEGFLVPDINIESCKNCGKCRIVCPVNNKKEELKLENINVYAAYSNDTEIRLHSSSGGIFSVVAKEILESGGIIYGAAYENSFRKVSHIEIEKKTDLKLLQGTKYLQSNVKKLYRRVREKLLENRVVYFVGTPCQVAGLKSFLGKEYDNLVTQSVVCHGVPSEKVWEKYLQELEKKVNANISEVEFRDKFYGWKNYRIRFRFGNSKEIKMHQKECAFFRGYIQNLFLRKSCYNCKFKGMNDHADITLGDFWGIKDACPVMDDNEGISLVLIKSKKGEMLWKKIENQIISFSVDFEKAIQKNPAVINSVEEHSSRNSFFEKLETEKVGKLINKFCPLSINDYIRIIIPPKMKKRVFYRKKAINIK